RLERLRRLLAQRREEAALAEHLGVERRGAVGVAALLLALAFVEGRLERVFAGIERGAHRLLDGVRLELAAGGLDAHDLAAVVRREHGARRALDRLEARP